MLYTIFLKYSSIRFLLCALIIGHLQVCYGLCFRLVAEFPFCFTVLFIDRYGLVLILFYTTIYVCF
jgi:hypothetical protein